MHKKSIDQKFRLTIWAFAAALALLLSSTQSFAKDYYEVLGVSKTATETEMKSVYRKLSMQFHPDRNLGDKVAEAKFKEISEAYGVLSKADKRQLYDRMSAAHSRGVPSYSYQDYMRRQQQAYHEEAVHKHQAQQEVYARMHQYLSNLNLQDRALTPEEWEYVISLLELRHPLVMIRVGSIISSIINKQPHWPADLWRRAPIYSLHSDMIGELFETQLKKRKAPRDLPKVVKQGLAIHYAFNFQCFKALRMMF